MNRGCRNPILTNGTTANPTCPCGNTHMGRADSADFVHLVLKRRFLPQVHGFVKAAFNSLECADLSALWSY